MGTEKDGECFDNPCIEPEFCIELEFADCNENTECLWLGGEMMGDCFIDICIPCGDVETQETCDAAPLCDWDAGEETCVS